MAVLARAGTSRRSRYLIALIDLVESDAGSRESSSKGKGRFSMNSPGHGGYSDVDASSYAGETRHPRLDTKIAMRRSDHLHFLADGRAERVDLESGRRCDLWRAGCACGAPAAERKL